MSLAHILVTGGAGFIGSNFVYHWLEQHANDHVVVLDLLTYAGNAENLKQAIANERCTLVQGDIGNEALVEGLLRQYSIKLIVNFAAESHVDRSISGPDVFIQTNVLGTHGLLKTAKSVWLDDAEFKGEHRFHHVSTDEVYGTLLPGEPAFTESHQYQPNSPYSASKAASDHLVRAYHHTYGLNVTTSNCSNNYGPFHFPEKLIPLCLTNALMGKPLPVYGEGRNIRDWLYVEDHCEGIQCVVENGVAGETYNIGGCNEWSNIDLISLLCDLLDEKFQHDPMLATRFPKNPQASGRKNSDAIIFVQDRAGHDFRYAIDMSKLEITLGFKSRTTFDDGLRKTIDWYLENEKWWRTLLDRHKK